MNKVTVWYFNKIPSYYDLGYLLTVSVFYHLGGVDVFHHDSPAFSLSGHLWVDAIDAHVTFQSVKPSHLWTSPGSCSRHRHTLNVLLFMWVYSLRITCPYYDSRFWVRTNLIGVTLAIPLMVSFLILSFLVFT